MINDNTQRGLTNHPPTSKGVLFFVLLFSLGFSATPIVNALRRPDANKDYCLWYQIGLVVRAGEPLYERGPSGELLYMYPPTAAVMLFAPLTYLGPVGFVVVLATVTGLSWAGCLYLAIRDGTGKWKGHPRWYYTLGLAVAVSYIYDLFLLGQINLFLLLLALLAMRYLRRRKPWLAGLSLGLAIAIKVFPLPILVYWAVRREGTAILAAALTLVLAVGVLPGTIRGFERNTIEAQQWFQLMIGDQSGNAMAARSIIGFTRRNQSLVSVAHRLTRDVEAGDTHGDGFKVNLVNFQPRTSHLIGLAALCVLGVILLFVTRLKYAPTHEMDVQETCMVFILVVLSSPLSWTYFFCWLLPAWMYLLHACRTRSWAIGPTIVSGFLLLSALSEQFDPTLQAYGVTAWGSVGLFLTLAAIRYKDHGTIPSG